MLTDGDSKNTRVYLEEGESQIHVKMIEITLQHGHGT